MELEVLGNWSAGPGADGACSGYLIRENGTKVLLDCGPGVVPALQRNHHCSDLSAVFISHMHADHCLDLLTLAYRLIRFSWRHGECPKDAIKPIPLYLPPGGRGVIVQWLKAFGRPQPSRSADPFATAFDISEWNPGEHQSAGSLSVGSLGMEHPVPTLGFKVTSLSGVFAYSADSRYCRNLVELARGTDLFLCEATERDPDSTTVQEGLHLTARQAGAVAREAGVGALLLTHLIRQDETWLRQLTEDAQDECRASVRIAMPGRNYKISASQYAGASA